MSVRTVLLLLIAAILVVSVIGGVMWLRSGGGPAISSRTVLEVDLTLGFAEDTPSGAFSVAFVEWRPRLRDVVSAIERAASDQRVVGILAKVGDSPGGLGMLQELRDAFLAFGASGKKSIAYAETFGEFGAGNGGYYLATAFDQIFLQPSGDVGLTGLRYEVPFLAGTFEKAGLEAQMGQRYEFKNAVNSYTESEFTPAHAEAMQDLVDSQFDQIVRGIAQRRGLAGERVREIVDLGPHLGAEALSRGLVDGLAYRDEVYDAAEAKWGEEVEYRDLVDYAKVSRPSSGAETIALIYGVGAISRGASGYDAITGSVRMGSETVAQAFRDAVDDEDVRAILFRVNSPGGSYVASDTIWREMVRARAAGKPVVASFGDVAGSGGYFVAMNADSIVAQPGTITGSIGVYGGKVVSRGLWKKIGTTFDAVSTSENSGMWSGVEGFDETGWRRMEDSLDRIYRDFVVKVAEGRSLAVEDVERVARGRIWTGERALENGLVDELGGFPVAYAALRRHLDLPADAPLAVRIFPAPKSPWQTLVEGLSSFETASRSAFVGLPPGRLRSLAGQITGAIQGQELLEMPYVPEFR